jgi:inner membrane protein
MDTITQITLGAAVGEVTLGKKVGNKAVLWGAVAGIIPDLDVLAGPFMDTVSRIAFHRGFTHSITFALMFAPIMAYLVTKLHKRDEAGWWDWSKLFFWAVVTHPILDNFTSYGTQFFWPFSEYRVAISTIFVIDPLYTVPFLLTVIALMFYHRSDNRRQTLNYLGLAVSTIYLTFTAVNYLYIHQKFSNELARQDIQYSRIIASPTPFNNFLWRGVAESEDGYWEGYYSHFDDGKEISFNYTPGNHQLISHLRNEKEIRKLIWITNGFYSMTAKNNSLYLNDMRYGKLNGWGKVEGEFVFSFLIRENARDRYGSMYITRERPKIPIGKQMLQQFFRRILGDVPA